MRVGLIAFLLFPFFLLPAVVAAQLAGKPARIHGESFVNLRSGPDLSHPATEVLREGQEVRVEKEEGSWYLVTLPDGRRGYVHRALVRLSDKPREKENKQTGETKAIKKTEATKEVNETRETVVRPAGEERGEERPSAPTPQLSAQIPKGQPLPVIKVLEGREWEVLGWLGVALCIFILGWVCGGNYYLRRDRIKRTKVHF